MLQQTGNIAQDEPWNAEIVLQKLHERFHKVDFNRAKQDALPFIKDPKTVNLWSEEFFTTVSDDKLKIEG
jgi:Mlc titration factor MtfA (ptsG expression regulator)